ncbi:MAG: LysM peptidoglycan-binding domain-containing protein [Actinomycetota bacterium]|nr:LysM peptidoglycan-binding domain-containing protein [Actinomycetota bacterium]
MTGSHRSTGARRRGNRVQMLVGAALVAAIAIVIVKVALSGNGTNPRGTPAAQETPTTASTAAAVTTVPAPAATPPAGSGASPGASASGYLSPAASAASGATATTHAAPLTYTVKPGDNLSVIAAWFKLHGYGGLYEANKAVLGDNPDLIHPGQTITVSGTGLTTGS